MQLLLIWAYVSYYARGWRAIRGFLKAFVKNAPILKLFWGKANQHQCPGDQEGEG
jgi:hypothetical protein